MGSLFKRYTFNGVNLDVDAVDLPETVWDEAVNMVPRVGAMHRADGYAEIWPTPLFAPHFLLYTPQLNVDYWLYGGDLGLAVVNNSGTHADITPAELTQSVSKNSWTGGNLNGIAVVNALENDPFYWFEGQATATVLPGLRAGTRYSVLRPFKYHLVALGVIDAGGTQLDALHWSDAADPGQVPSSWVPDPGNEAGDNILADENGAIVDGMALRDSFYIYKQDSVYEMTYTGGQLVFRFRKVFGTTGVLARNCVVRVEGTHVVLGNGDIYQHDGQNIRSIVDGRIRRSFFAAIDNDNFTNSFVMYIEPKQEVWFCAPTTGNSRPNVALVWNITSDSFGFRSIPETDFGATGIISPPSGSNEDWDTDAAAWDDDTTIWLQNRLDAIEDGALLADYSGVTLFQADFGNTAHGAGYDSRVSRMGLPLDDAANVKAIRRIWPRIDTTNTDMQFRLELFDQESPASNPNLVADIPFQIGPEGVPVTVNCRYMGVKISTTESSPWSLAGLDVEYMPRGRF